MPEVAAERPPSPLASAQSAITEWWATPKGERVSPEQFVRSKGGFKSRRGLVEQVQRIAMAEAHRVAALYSLSDAEADALVAFALDVAKVPEW